MLSAPTKQESKLLEPFKGLLLKQIFVPGSKEEFISAAKEIINSKIVGFDTESKPIFKKDQKNDGPHVVQFALLNKAFIFQLHHKHCLESLLEIFQSDKVVKVGFGLKSDKTHIYNKFGVKLNAVLDLDSAFREKGYRGQIGARGAVAIVFNRGFNKSKRISTSNWALPYLSQNQLLYAANDAYVALCVYNKLDSQRSSFNKKIDF